MLDSFLLKGIFIGFSISAIVGPIGILCIRRSMAYGLLSGLATGFGAAMADVVYATIAALGLTVVADIALKHATFLRLFGGIYLFYLGIKILSARPPQLTGSPQKRMSFLKTATTTFFITLSNPMTIGGFALIFTTYDIDLVSVSLNFTGATFLVTGIFIGGMTWWLFLSSLSSFLGSKLRAQTLKLINIISGSLIITFGLYFLLSAFYITLLHWHLAHMQKTH